MCAAPDGYLDNSTDCDDTESTISPGSAEVWYDGVDQDCAGGDDYDQDGDGVAYDLDCDDDDPTSLTRAVDGDCDGVLTVDDCDDADPLSTVTSEDSDCDGYISGVDCDDSDAASTYRGNDEDCDGVVTLEDCDDRWAASTIVSTDADCDGVITSEDCDDSDAGSTVLSEDGDCDGVLTADDCDDSNAEITFCGTSAATAVESCAVLFDDSTGAADGSYWLDPDGSGAFQVDCDMTGGWIQLQISDTDSILTASYDWSNPWYKCSDDSAAYYDWLSIESDITEDYEASADATYDVTVTYKQPSTGTVYTAAQVEAIRSIVTELHSDTRMVVTTADDDNYDYHSGSPYGHEVYVQAGGSGYTLLSPGTNGDCGGGFSDWPRAGSLGAFYVWSTDSSASEVSGTTGISSSDLGALSSEVIIPENVRLVVRTGGGVSWGYEQEVFKVR